MQFDAIKVKNSNSKSNSRKNKKIEKQINKINKVYPVKGVTEEGYIRTKIGLYESVFEIFDVKKYDLFLLDDSEIDFVTENNWKMQKLYPHSLKEVYMNFQEENKEQQEYFKYKIERTTSISQLEVLNNELEKLKFIEKTYEMRDTYIFVFGDNVSDLNKKIDNLYRFNNFLELKKISLDKKKKIINKLNNRD